MKRWSTACTALAAVLLLLGVFAAVVDHNVLDEQRFARNVDTVRQDPAVAHAVGELIAQQTIDAYPDLVVARPAVESLSISVAGSSALSPIVRHSAAVLHQSLTGQQSGDVALRLLDIGTVLTGVLPSVSPQAAEHISPDMSVTLAHVSNHSMSGRLIGLVRLSGLLSWLLPLLAVLLFAAGILLAPSRQRSVVRTGWAIALCGGAIGLVAVIGLIVASVQDSDTLTGALVAAGWHVLAPQLWWCAALALLVGLVVAAAGSARLPDADLGALATRSWQLISRRPENRWGIAGRGALLVVLGAGAVFRPALTFGVLAGLAGIVVLVSGLAELAFAAGFRPQQPEAGSSAPARRWMATRVALVALAGIVAVVVAVAALPSSRPTTAAAAATKGATASDACNGYVQLCDRRYDEVAFPAAHNAMSAADESGWYAAEQSTGIVGSLDAGVRVLLVDSYYGQHSKKKGLIITAPASRAAGIEAATEDYGPDVVASAKRLRNSVTSAPVGPVSEYLCHGLCELGATAWEPLMAQVRTWLAAHPREVVTFFVEDTVSPADTAKVFREAGLLPYVYTPTDGKPWPTLGSMISSGHRLVVLMERRGGGSEFPWLLQGFDWVQDTPYTNPTPASLTCRLNRGAKTNDLFMLNYWLANFDSLVTDARTINKFDVLWPYASRCERKRGQIPNFVAVNYASEGDLLRVVDKLNGVGSG
ncbi:hypothetical protein [Flexivirga oryzae]|uniref:Uncharacterized membrane protein HdeD (DUF308 family) n=1 Tax=Flexivirga oryzae TaxID=1794944 RepID=A0A839NFY9_9MICO|nr:hypothetical protein [Flexivirga oryzae]MBB2894055.1 uncharacterized membrane protein HdeD (DUF308 family) [Flexivirga oryzae]